MKNLFSFVLMLVALVASQGQTFEEKVSEIRQEILLITDQEKAALKQRIDEIDEQRINGMINPEMAAELKSEAAEQSAAKIESRILEQEERLSELVFNEANDAVLQSNVHSNDTVRIKAPGIDIVIDSDKINKEDKSEKRTTSQGVFAFGFNNLAGDSGLFSDDIRVWNSRFYEYGITFKTRLMPNSPLLNLKYGASLLYNNLRPTEDRIFVTNGNQTLLQAAEYAPTRHPRFRNFYINVPLHLEFDFSKPTFNSEGERVIKSQESWRLGLGGYAGFLVNSAQFMRYNQDGKRIKMEERGDFNVNSFNYGVSAYLAYKSLGVYAKYDLQPLFKHNPIEQNNFSLGLRWDLH